MNHQSKTDQDITLESKPASEAERSRTSLSRKGGGTWKDIW